MAGAESLAERQTPSLPQPNADPMNAATVRYGLPSAPPNLEIALAQIYESSYPQVDIVDSAITPFVLRHADQLADKVAIIDGATGQQVTYGALRDQIQRLAGGMKARGIGPGTTVALMAPNGPGFVVVFHAAAWAGATVTTLNPTYGPDELAYQLRDSQASWMFTVGLFAEVAGAACDQASIANRVLLDGGVAGWHDLACALWGAAHRAGPRQPRQRRRGPALLVGHHRLPQGGDAHAPQPRRQPRPEPSGHRARARRRWSFAVLPFFHIYGMTVLMNYTLANGRHHGDPAAVRHGADARAHPAHRMTRLFLVPPIVLGLAKHPIVDNYDLSSVRQIFSGAAPLGRGAGGGGGGSLWLCSGPGLRHDRAFASDPRDWPRGGASGQLGAHACPTPRPAWSTPTRATTRRSGERGELWISGPQVMKGYLNNEEATRNTIDAQGWLHTGDIAIIDDDGFVFIVDRLKELIKVKGFQVPPAELEALVIQHPDVADVAVIGVPDEESGELPKAFVVRKPDTTVDADTLKAFVAEHVSTYKQLHHVEFIAEIPKSASGKILRRLLRDRG